MLEGFTSTKEITITPATITNNISVGAATGDGLNISQTTFSKMQAPSITLGGSGYEGTITVENLTGTPGRLNLIADGTGGAINISGDLDLDGKDASGISLYIQGSGATTDLSGTITTAGAAIVADAVRLVGDTNINTSGGSVTITGGTDGIYSQLDNNFNLSINAGAGSIFVGNTTGFGDNSGSDSLVGTVVLDSTSSIWLGDGNQSIGNDLDVLNATLVLEGNTNLFTEFFEWRDFLHVRSKHWCCRQQLQPEYDVWPSFSTNVCQPWGSERSQRTLRRGCCRKYCKIRSVWQRNNGRVAGIRRFFV